MKMAPLITLKVAFVLQTLASWEEWRSGGVEEVP